MNITEARNTYEKAQEMLKWLEEEEKKFNEWKEKQENEQTIQK